MTKDELLKMDYEYAKAIAQYLIKRCETDTYLTEAITNCNDKDLKGCVTYIKGEARKKAQDGCAILPDDEVYQMAVHYYLEGGIKNKDDVEEEKTEEENTVATKPKKEKTKKEEAKQEIKKQLTLFDFM